MTRIALYVRVSKKDGSQDTANQLEQLRSYAALHQYTIVAVYRDEESGRKGRGERGQFDQMFRDAARGQFDILLFWSLDRFTREGIAQTLFYLRQLEEYGVRFHSLREEFLNSDIDFVRPIVLAVFAHLAQYEAMRISERTKAGLERAVRSGKRLGRPNKQDHHRLQIRTWLSDGVIPAEIIRGLRKHLSASSVRRIIKAIREEEEAE